MRKVESKEFQSTSQQQDVLPQHEQTDESVRDDRGRNGQGQIDG